MLDGMKGETLEEHKSACEPKLLQESQLSQLSQIKTAAAVRDTFELGPTLATFRSDTYAA